METEYKSIDCTKNHPTTCRKTPFGVMVYKLHYKSSYEDKKLIDELIEKAVNLAEKVNPGAANDSTYSRTQQRILANCIAGIVSEYFWRLFLNSEDEIVTETDFEESANQIDLKVISNNKKIEVRSSFPRNGIEFAICHGIYQFDILGPYSNSYKPGEIQKDYYVRTLFHLDPPTSIIQKIKEDGFCIYLTGGATWNMMINDRYSVNKTLIPQDSFDTQVASEYRVVPFSNAIDTQQVKQVIIRDMIE